MKSSVIIDMMLMLGFDTTSKQTFKGSFVVYDWIKDLESSDSRLHKESVIEKAYMASKLGSASAQCFLFNCYLAYNPFFTYNIKQVPETQGLTNKDNPWVDFWSLCESLRTRSITGNHMRRMVDELSQRFDSEEWNNICRRVLIKDLRCGISEKTLNKVLGRSEWAIPTFGCQLAQDSTDQVARLKGEARIETKLDGVRVLAVFNSGVVTLYSRNGKVFNNFSHIENALYECYQEIWQLIFNRNPYAENFVLDGEIIGDSFQDLMKQAHRKKDADASDSRYYVFDAIPLIEFQSGSWSVKQHKRIEMLESVRDQFKETDCLRVMPGITVNLATPEGHDIMRRFAEDAVAEGYEGIMIKDLDAPYECKRTKSWLKWKPTITVDLTISDFEEGTGRNSGRLVAIVCEGVDDERNIRVNVGSGFSDTNRDEYWNNRDRLLGCVVEVQADAVTQNQDGSYSLRFPRFVRFRGFEPGEKI